MEQNLKSFSFYHKESLRYLRFMLKRSKYLKICFILNFTVLPLDNVMRGARSMPMIFIMCSCSLRLQILNSWVSTLFVVSHQQKVRVNSNLKKKTIMNNTLSASTRMRNNYVFTCGPNKSFKSTLSVMTLMIGSIT
mgnify:CR=1 FL=1